MPNQFNSRVDPDLLAEYLMRGKNREQMVQMAQQVQATPNLCLIPLGADHVYFRVCGTLRKLAIRSLVYYQIHHTAPVFHQCSCDQKRCVNPLHQRVAK